MDKFRLWLSDEEKQKEPHLNQTQMKSGAQSVMQWCILMSSLFNFKFVCVCVFCVCTLTEI